MLLMTCSLGGMIRIGDEIQLTLQGRGRDHLTVSVIAPARADLYFDGVCVRPLLLPSGTQSYFFSLRAVRRFRVDEIEVGFWLPGDALPLAASYEDCVHVGIAAPRSFRIGYEHDARASESSELEPSSRQPVLELGEECHADTDATDGRDNLHR